VVDRAIVLFVTPDTGEISGVNQAASSLYGYSIKELKNKKIIDLDSNFSPDKLLTDKLAVTEKKQFSTTHQLADGGTAKVIVVVEPILIGNQNLLQLTVKPQKEAAQQKNKYRKLFNKAADALLVVDESKRVKQINKAAKRITGWGEEALELEIAEVFPIKAEETGKSELSLIQKVLTTGNQQQLPKKTVLPTKEGTEIFIAGTAVPVETKTGSREVVINFRDVTSQRKLHRQLQKQKQRYQILFENTGAGTVLVTEKGKITLVNKRFTEITGYSKAEIKGESWTKLVANREDLEQMIDYHQAKLAGKEEVPPKYEFKLETKTGGTKNILVAEAAVPGREEVIYSLTDITYLKNLEVGLEATIEKLNLIVEKTIDTLGDTVRAMDAYTSGHQERVAKLAVAIADELGISNFRKKGLKLAALVHDLGKIKNPIGILTKPSSLTELEFKMIKEHPQVGCEILKELDFKWPVAKIVKQHHEKIDGSGYPEGLTGEEILLEARIITVADVVEAMNSHRPYRPALGLEAALDEIKKNQGQLYDPEVVEACIEIFADKESFEEFLKDCPSF